MISFEYVDFSQKSCSLDPALKKFHNQTDTI